MITVVIPSKNAENLSKCIPAIRELDPKVQIIVVDDGIDFNGYTLDVNHFVRGKKPFIFSRNVNIGIMAAEHNSDVIVLNDDAVLKTPNGFTALQEVANQNPEYGLIAAATNNVGNQNQLPQKQGLREEPRMVCFVCVFIPAKTIDRVGLLDERYVGYGLDDDDYCLRVRNSRLKIGIYDGCVVDHGSLKSTYRAEGPASYKPNLKIFIDKWGVDNWGKSREVSQWPELFA